MRVALAGSSDGWLQMEYRTSDNVVDPGGDSALLENGYATETAIQGISEVSLEEVSVSKSGDGPPEAVVTRVPASGTPGH